MTVTKQPNTNSLELTEKLDRAVAELSETLPADVHVSTDSFRQARFIEGSIDNIQKSLFEGAVFVVIVLLVFLMNFRTTVISLVALPLSLLVSILALKWMGLTINTMSLGGMAIAIGSLVDDAIIDVENVFKRLRENFARPKDQRLPTLSIVFEASKEIRTSVVHATIITIVAFVPLFFLDGMEGRMLRPLGISFIVALFASMIVAVTLTPVLCSYLLTGDRVLRRNEKEPVVSRFLKRVYRRALEWVLAHKKAVLGSTVVLFAGALAVFLSLGRSFLPPFNERLADDQRLDDAGHLARRVRQDRQPSGKHSARNTRNPDGRPQNGPRRAGRACAGRRRIGNRRRRTNSADRSRSEFMADVRRRLGVLHGVNIEIGQPISHRIDAMLSGTKANIAIKLFGPDLNRLFALGNRIKSSIADIDGIADLNVEQQIERPQLQIRPKREMLARYGITLPAFRRIRRGGARRTGRLAGIRRRTLVRRDGQGIGCQPDTTWSASAS